MVDPVDAMLADEVRRDHAKAKARGERVAGIVSRVRNEMVARSLLSADDIDFVMGAMCHALVDELYGNAAVDLPDLWFLGAGARRGEKEPAES